MNTISKERKPNHIHHGYFESRKEAYVVYKYKAIDVAVATTLFVAVRNNIMLVVVVVVVVAAVPRQSGGSQAAFAGRRCQADGGQL